MVSRRHLLAATSADTNCMNKSNPLNPVPSYFHIILRNKTLNLSLLDEQVSTPQPTDSVLPTP
jgi:hypothetical protein